MEQQARTLIVGPADRPAHPAWHLAYQEGDRYRIWAGGVHEETLRLLIAAERQRYGGVTVEDRRERPGG